MTAEVLAANTAQRDLLSNVSHDLKTPLTSIQGYAQAIIDGAAEDPGEAAQIIYEEAGRLNRHGGRIDRSGAIADGSAFDGERPHRYGPT